MIGLEIETVSRGKSLEATEKLRIKQMGRIDMTECAMRERKQLNTVKASI